MQQSVLGKGSTLAITDLGVTAPCWRAPSPFQLQKMVRCQRPGNTRDFWHWRSSYHFTHSLLTHYCSLLTSKFIRKCSCDTSTVGTDRQWESQVPGIMWSHRVQMCPSASGNTGEQKGMQQEQWGCSGSGQIGAGVFWRWRHVFWQAVVWTPVLLALVGQLLGMTERNSRMWPGTG